MDTLLALRDNAIDKFSWIAVADILLVAFLIYQVLSIVRGRRAAQVLTGFIVLVAVYLVALILGLELLRSSLATLAPYTAFGVIVMFQSEIRRFLARLGRRRLMGFGTRLQRRERAEEIALAVELLAQSKTGALIVVERDIGLRTFIESGVPMDAHLSRDLLLSIFHSGGALHDGAVIIQGDRIAAAACFLPLNVNPALAAKMGTRHRSAIGITEETDCMAIVVSEETGMISIAAGGEIERNVTSKEVENRLAGQGERKERRAESPARRLAAGD
jgi:diadenylate cyclase